MFSNGNMQTMILERESSTFVTSNDTFALRKQPTSLECRYDNGRHFGMSIFIIRVNGRVPYITTKPSATPLLDALLLQRRAMPLHDIKIITPRSGHQPESLYA